MEKYKLMGYSYNPYTGQSEHYFLFDIPEYNGWVDWDYIMDCEKEAASEEFEPYWENNTEPESTDTEACIIVGEVDNKRFFDFVF